MVLETYIGLRCATLFLACLRLFLSGMTVLLAHALQTAVLRVIGVNTVTRFFNRRFLDTLFDVGKTFQNLLTTCFAIVDNFFHDFIGL